MILCDFFKEKDREVPNRLANHPDMKPIESFRDHCETKFTKTGSFLGKFKTKSACRKFDSEVVRNFIENIINRQINA